MVGRKARANGEGTVFFDRRRKFWIARFSFWEGGKLKKVSRSGKTKGEALRRMKEAQAEFGGSIALDASQPLAEYLAAWLEESVANDVSESTYERYEQNVRLHIVPALGRIKLRDLGPAEITRFRNTLVRKGLAPGTINHCLVTLDVALNRAVDWTLLSRNPGKSVKKLKDAANDMVCLSEEEAGRLVKVSEGTKREALYAVALKCGLRQGELLALKWEDLGDSPDVVEEETLEHMVRIAVRAADTKELTVRRSVDTTGPMPRWGATKGKEERVITLPESLCEALSRHRKLQMEDRLAARFWEDTGLVFPDKNGRVQRGHVLLYQLRKDLATAGLPRIRFHDTRDTAATLMLKHGTPLHVVAKILGHKDAALTLRRYAHVLPDARQDAARRMDEFTF